MEHLLRLTPHGPPTTVRTDPKQNQNTGQPARDQQRKPASNANLNHFLYNLGLRRLIWKQRVIDLPGRVNDAHHVLGTLPGTGWCLVSESPWGSSKAVSDLFHFSAPLVAEEVIAVGREVKGTRNPSVPGNREKERQTPGSAWLLQAGRRGRSHRKGLSCPWAAQHALLTPTAPEEKLPTAPSVVREDEDGAHFFPMRCQPPPQAPCPVHPEAFRDTGTGNGEDRCTSLRVWGGGAVLRASHLLLATSHGAAHSQALALEICVLVLTSFSGHVN